jgi:hypothetical protein
LFHWLPTTGGYVEADVTAGNHWSELRTLALLITGVSLATTGINLLTEPQPNITCR